MKVELKNVHFSEHFSDETYCMDATIWIDGKKAGFCENEGCGGNTFLRFDDPKVEAKFEAWAKTLPPTVTDLKDPHDPTKPFIIESDGESVIDGLFDQWLAKRDEQKRQKWAKKQKALHVRMGYPITIELRDDTHQVCVACKIQLQVDALVEATIKKHNLKHPIKISEVK